MSRLGSVINGVIEPQIAGGAGVGPALWTGFGICCFSWLCGMGLVAVDTYADKKDGKKAELSEEDKFRWH